MSIRCERLLNVTSSEMNDVCAELRQAVEGMVTKARATASITRTSQTESSLRQLICDVEWLFRNPGFLGLNERPIVGPHVARHHDLIMANMSGYGTPGYDSLRTFLLKQFGEEISPSSLTKLLSWLLQEGIVATAAEADGLSLTDTANAARIGTTEQEATADGAVERLTGGADEGDAWTKAFQGAVKPSGPTATEQGEGAKPPAGPYDDLLALADKADLSRMEAKVIRVIAQKGGWVSLPDANTLCGGDA